MGKSWKWVSSKKFRVWDKGFLISCLFKDFGIITLENKCVGKVVRGLYLAVLFLENFL